MKARLADIEQIVIETQEPGVRIIDKTGPLANPADRDHCIQYMVAIPLIFGRLTAADYEDAVAYDPRVDELRNRMVVRENTTFTEEYYAADKRYIGNAVQVFFRDGSSTERAHFDFPIGHRKRRAEGIPVLKQKFEASVAAHFSPQQTGKIAALFADRAKLDAMPVHEFVAVMAKGFLTGATLTDGARALGIELTTEQVSRLVRHLDLMDEWGARMNLTAIRDREQQLTKHVLDSLSVRPWLRGERVADLGSGAGFPGIPLAIVEPARHFALIESTGKKCDFLRHVAGELGLANVEIVQSRAEAYRPPLRFGTVVARAVGPIADLVRRGAHLVAGGGRLLAMKGRLPEAELAARLNGWKLAGVHRLAVPGLAEERHLVELCHSHEKSPGND